MNFDSLQTILDRYSAEDTVKARMLVNFANEIRRTDQVKGIAAAEQAISITQRLKQPLLEGDAYMVKGLNLFNQGKQQDGIEQMAHSYEIYEGQHNTMKASRAAIRVGELAHYISDYSTMKDFCLKAETGFKKLGDQASIARCYNGLGVACLNLSENEKAMAYLNQAAEMNQSLKDTIGLTGNFENFGVLYTNLSNYPKALEYFQKALSLHEKLGKRGNPGVVYNNISGIYYHLKDYPKSLEYDQKALNLFENSENRINMGASYVNMAAKYKEMGDYPKSLEYNQKGKSILESLHAQQFLAICISNIGGTYDAMQDYGQAYRFYTEAQGLFDALGFSAEVARVKINTGKIIQISSDTELQKMDIDPKDRLKVAEKYTLEGVEKARESGSLENELLGQKVLSNIYENSGDYVKSLKAFQSYVALRDSVSGEDIRQEITRKEIQFEFDKKEASLKFEQQLTAEQLAKQQLLSIQQQQSLLLKEQALALSNKEKDLQHLAFLKEQAEKQKKEQQLGLAEKDKQLQEVQLGSLLQEKALQLKTLAEKNALIGLLIAGISAILLAFAAFYWWVQQKQVKKEAATQAQFTRQLLENIEEDRDRIAIDLHDSVSHDLLILKQSIRKEITGPEVEDKIDDIINGIRQISRNLHPVMLDKIGLRLSLETLCEQFMLHETMYVSHEIDYQNTLPKTAELQLFRIVQEGLTNALKYSKAEAVKVQIKSSGNELRLEIQDNGKGFDVEKALEGGKAFGLHSILQRAKAIGGKAEIKSSEGGTAIRVMV
ncbi:MAG: sensor histidine kinase [Saprospiraceae bacterium]|nr:sensor histidine kinase [Saprospiraceae bacterium]